MPSRHLDIMINIELYELAKLNDKEAVNQLKKNAQAKTPDLEAMLYLGLCYHQGYGVKVNLEKTIKYWHEASKPGNCLFSAKHADTTYFYQYHYDNLTLQSNPNINIAELLKQPPQNIRPH